MKRVILLRGTPWLRVTFSRWCALSRLRAWCLPSAGAAPSEEHGMYDAPLPYPLTSPWTFGCFHILVPVKNDSCPSFSKYLE